MTEKNKHFEQELQRRDKAGLIAIITLMLQQHPELSWILQASQPAHSIDSRLFPFLKAIMDGRTGS